MKRCSCLAREIQLFGELLLLLYSRLCAFSDIPDEVCAAFECSLWDVNSAQQVASNATARNLVTALRWLPGEMAVLQGSEDLRLRLWDIRTSNAASMQLQIRGSFVGHSNIPMDVDVSTDGVCGAPVCFLCDICRLVMSWFPYFVGLTFLSCHKGFDGNGCEVRVWDRRQGVVRQICAGHTQAVHSCTFLRHSFKGEVAASAGRDKTLRIWATNTGAVSAEHYFDSAVLSICSLSTSTGRIDPANDPSANVWTEHLACGCKLCI